MPIGVNRGVLIGVIEKWHRISKLAEVNAVAMHNLHALPYGQVLAEMRLVNVNHSDRMFRYLEYTE
jgi:hypothetical protein